jgi:hypothetical protein
MKDYMIQGAVLMRIVMKITTADDRENTVGRISTTGKERVCTHQIVLLLQNDFIIYRYNNI